MNLTNSIDNIGPVTCYFGYLIVLRLKFTSHDLSSSRFRIIKTDHFNKRFSLLCLNVGAVYKITKVHLPKFGEKQISSHALP